VVRVRCEFLEMPGLRLTMPQAGRHFRREMRGVRVHRDIYVSVCGSDLVRLEDGRFVVLEDNLRVPSGVSYMLANRDVTKRVMPGLFDRYQVSPIAKMARRCWRRSGRSRRRTSRSPPSSF
jgi:uncharacterized circularly permuted ATP-grasp superfamily protein